MTHLSRRALVVGSSLVTSAAFAQNSKVAFSAKKGIGMFPWFNLTRELPSPSIVYAWPPFQTQRSIPRPLDLQKIANAGFDHIRLTIDPGPFVYFSGIERKTLINQVTDAIDACIKENLAVVVVLTPNEATHYWNSRRFMEDETHFKTYLSVLKEFALKLNPYPASKIALEPMNEPQYTSGSRIWEEKQRLMHQALRENNRKHSIILTGTDGSWIHGLRDFNPSSIKDANTLFTFHFYEPFSFTHQGGQWVDVPTRLLAHMPWPIDMNLKEAAIIATTRNILRTTQEAEAQKVLLGKAKIAIDKYFVSGFNKQMFRDFFAVAQNWARKYNISQDRLYVGEFGVVKESHKFLASLPHHRAQWIKDVREICEDNQHPWCFWNYFDVLGLVVDDNTRILDENILTALGLKK